MFDPDTSALIRSTPPLEGLDREQLPEFLTDAFAQIAAARVRFREAVEDVPDELNGLIEQIRRLAFTNEALVSILPEREDRSAAAFVAATAHQLCFNADQLTSKERRHALLDNRMVSSDIASMLLFLIAESSADASEIARSITLSDEDPIRISLIASLCDLANGDLLSLLDRELPSSGAVYSDEIGESATNALYLETLRGVRKLANQLLYGQLTEDTESAIESFKRIRSISIAPREDIADHWDNTLKSSFSGPHHLASLLIAVAKDLTENAVTCVPAPPNLDPDQWRKSMQRVAQTRPYLWRNHRDAISKGYLNPGTSAAVGFPTGAGKSTLAELKINTKLLQDQSIIFLCPTHALVEQTVAGLRKSFPTASVQGERLDEFGFSSETMEQLPEIFVMTPESCLAQVSIEPSVFAEVGLLVFDECHLLHPSDRVNDRRAIDAMLCVLILPHVASELDILLLSAMMKNVEEIAEWISELLSAPCLALSLAWKPTRQLRGALVYEQSRIDALDAGLKSSRKQKKTQAPSTKDKSNLTADPLALFSLKQTWATENREDYTLVSLSDQVVTLAASKYWGLTPNAVSVSSSIAARSANNGIKALVFFQSIKNAVSAAKQMSEQIGTASIKLLGQEEQWATTASLELGDASHMYMRIKNGKALDAASVHHGLLLPEERFLCESLYKRRNGIKALAATSTLTQGMNLPSELVIIAEDSRFDEENKKREILKAQELLNAAGRAGRAGEGASGIVLVVPGQVVGIDNESSTIGPHWSALRDVFGQSDQCLEIDDPLTAILDRIHAGIDGEAEIEKYAITRLARGSDQQARLQNLSIAVKNSLGAYHARKLNNSDQIEERIQAALNFFGAQVPETQQELIQNQVAASLGLSLELVMRLSKALEENGPDDGAIVPDWRRWFFRWLRENPDLIEHVCRPSTLAEMFGKKKYEKLNSSNEKAALVLPALKKLTWLWMRGAPLNELERALGTEERKLKTCVQARRFALRVIPEISFLFTLPALLHERSQAGKEIQEPLPAAVSQLGRCVKLGFNSHEKLALNQILRKAHFSRRELHQRFTQVKSHLSPPDEGEVWEKTLERVERASEAELNARDTIE